MFSQRNLKRDLVALCIAALAAFIGVSLLTYDSADPVSLDTSPERQNVFGATGAIVAYLLISNIGLLSFFSVIGLTCVSIWLWRNEEIKLPLMRTIGWCLATAGLATFLGLFVPDLVSSYAGQSGGRVGSFGSEFLQQQFSLIGGAIITVFVSAAGLLMFSDYALLKFARWTMSKVVSPTRNRTQTAKRPARRMPEIDEVDDLDEESIEEEDPEFTVRFRRRENQKTEPPESEIDWEEDPLDSEEYESEDDELEEEWDEEPEDTEQELAVRAKPRPTTSAVPNQPHFKKKKRSKPAPADAKEDEREEVMHQLDQASLEQPEGEYALPNIDLLLAGDEIPFEVQEQEVRTKAKILEKTFSQFGFNVKVVEIETGPVIAQYEIELEAGLRLSKIMGLADDLAIALRVPSVRIVAPIPGKNTVGIEVPNETRQVVRLRDVMEEGAAKTQKMKIPLFLGKDVSGNPLIADLAALPHLLIAGRTGTGKSVCLNAIISSILMTRRPDEIRMLMIDPKMVELSGYGRLPHLMHPVVTDMKKAEAILAWAVDKMEERYSLLARAGVRHITSYNQLGEEELLERLEIDDPEEKENVPLQLPFIVIVADEMADLMMTAGKEVEQHIIRLAQKSRAVGIHLILATQKPTVDVITGLIKSNLPARISFQVASRTDSRVVLDEMGADKLLGNGDMLFLWPGTSKLLRGQGTYLSDDEIDSVTDSCSQGEQDFVNELMNLKVKEDEEEGAGPAALKKRDDLYESAVDVVVREGRGSVSLLQRTLGIGYGRAARLIDFMAEDNIVGPYNGSQAREVVVSVADWEAMQGMEPTEDSDEAPAEASSDPPPKPKPKVRTLSASEVGKGKRKRKLLDKKKRSNNGPVRLVGEPDEETEDDDYELTGDDGNWETPESVAHRSPGSNDEEEYEIEEEYEQDEEVTQADSEEYEDPDGEWEEEESDEASGESEEEYEYYYDDDEFEESA